MKSSPRANKMLTRPQKKQSLPPLLQTHLLTFSSHRYEIACLDVENPKCPQVLPHLLTQDLCSPTTYGAVTGSPRAWEGQTLLHCTALCVCSKCQWPCAGSDPVSCQNWWPWSLRAEPCPGHLSIYAGLDCLPQRCSEGPSALSSLHLALWPQRRAPRAPEVQASVNPQGSLASQDSGAAGIWTATSPGLLHSC